MSEARPSVDGSPAAAWRFVSPAPRSAGLEVGGRFSRIRGGVLAQVREADSVALYRGDQVLAVAMFARHGWRRTEMALAISHEAAPHMRRLVRIAQLTLSAMADDRLIIVHVRPSNRVGQRMAMLAGFRRARLKHAGIWVFERER